MTDYQIDILRKGGFFDTVLGVTNIVSELLNRRLELEVDWSKAAKQIVTCKIGPFENRTFANTAIGVSTTGSVAEAILYAVLEGCVNRLWQ